MAFQHSCISGQKLKVRGMAKAAVGWSDCQEERERERERERDGGTQGQRCWKAQHVEKEKG